MPSTHVTPTYQLALYLALLECLLLLRRFGLPIPVPILIPIPTPEVEWSPLCRPDPASPSPSSDPSPAPGAPPVPPEKVRYSSSCSAVRARRLASVRGPCPGASPD